MAPSLLYARKQLLPSRSASVLQSMNMAAAFARSGYDTYSFPGVRPPDAHGAKGMDPRAVFDDFLEECGLRAGDFVHCRPLRAGHKGLYGLAYRAYVLRACLRENAVVFTRDVADALFVRRIEALRKPDKRKRGRFLFEMHEALFAMHKSRPGRHDWRKTREREKRILAAVDGIVVVNADIAGMAREDLGYAGPVLVEPNGFNPAIFKALPLFTGENPWPGGGEDVRLAYVGAMHESKGVPELLRAMALLPRHFRLRVIGGGAADIPAMRAFAADLGLGGDRVRFMGHVPQKNVWQSCLGCHMAIVPQQPGVAYFSPIKITEAMALGLPLVMTPLRFFSACRNLVQMAEDCGPEALAAAIRDLAARPARARELRDAGLAQAREKTWLARAARILDFAASLA